MAETNLKVYFIRSNDALYQVPEGVHAKFLEKEEEIERLRGALEDAKVALAQANTKEVELRARCANARADLKDVQTSMTAALKTEEKRAQEAEKTMKAAVDRLKVLEDAEREEWNRAEEATKEAQEANRRCAEAEAELGRLVVTGRTQLQAARRLAERAEKLRVAKKRDYAVLEEEYLRLQESLYETEKRLGPGSRVEYSVGNETFFVHPQVMEGIRLLQSDRNKMQLDIDARDREIKNLRDMLKVARKARRLVAEDFDALRAVVNSGANVTHLTNAITLFERKIPTSEQNDSYVAFLLREYRSMLVKARKLFERPIR